MVGLVANRNFGRCLQRRIRRDILRRLNSSCGLVAHGRRRIGGGRYCRLGLDLDGLRPLLHSIPQRAQDRGKIFAGRTCERGHCLGDGEADALECASRLGSERSRPPAECWADQVGETLQNIHSYGALAAHPISDGAIERALHLLVDRKRSATTRCEPLQLLESFDIVTAMLERPKLRRQRARRRLEQKRDVDVIGAKPHAMLAQNGPQSLVEALEIVGDLAAFENAQRFHKLVRNATGKPRDVLGRTQHEQWCEQALYMGARP